MAHPGRAAAQLRVELAASHARPPAGLDVDPGTYLTAGLRWIRAGAASVFAGAEGGWAVEGDRGDWTSAFGGLRLTTSLVGAVEGGVSAVATGFRVEAPDPFRAALLRIQPTVAASLGGARWEGRLHGGAGRVRVGEAEYDVWLKGAGFGVRRAVGPALLELSADAYGTGVTSYRTLAAAAESYVGDAALRLEISGWRTGEGEDHASGQLRLEIPVGRAARGVALAGRSAPDPLLGTPPGAYASTSVGLDVSEALRRPEPPVVEMVEPHRARFTIRRPDARVVELLGDFSRWEAIPMRREDDVWAVVVEVDQDLHHFGFRVDGEWWVPEEAPGRTEDEWGRPTATLVVPGA